MANKVSVYEKQLLRAIKEIPEEYLPNLLQIVRLFHESVTLKPAKASFRQGWKEALTSETHPISELCEDIEAE